MAFCRYGPRGAPWPSAAEAEAEAEPAGWGFCEVVWEKGMVVIWHNHAVIHRRLGAHRAPHHPVARCQQRVLVFLLLLDGRLRIEATSKHSFVLTV